MTHSNDQLSKLQRPQMRSTSRKVPAPAMKSPGTERGLTHSPYFNGPLYERMSEDLHLGGKRPGNPFGPAMFRCERRPPGGG